MKPFSFYGITSFAAVLLAGALVFLLVHQAAIVEVTELAQRSNLALAQTALNLVKKDVAELLDATNSAKIVSAQIPRLPRSLDSAVNDLLRNPAVVRLEVNHRPREAGYLPALLRHDGEYALSLDKIEQQVKLSGGSFSLQPNAMLGVVVRATWSRLDAGGRR